MSEVLIAYLANQLTMLLAQTALVFVFILPVFKITCIGSVSLAMFITVMQGLCGMCNGTYLHHLVST